MPLSPLGQEFMAAFFMNTPVALTLLSQLVVQSVGERFVARHFTRASALQPSNMA